MRVTAQAHLRREIVVYFVYLYCDLGEILGDAAHLYMAAFLFLASCLIYFLAFLEWELCYGGRGRLSFCCLMIPRVVGVLLVDFYFS